MCLPEPVTSKLGIFGRIIDPGLATSELVGKVYEPAGQILNPGKWDDLITPKAPEVERAQTKTPEQLERDRSLAIQKRKERAKQASLIQSIQDEGGDISGGTAGTSGVATGTQKLDSILTAGQSSLLGV